ncbi:MAG TPA: undecaprenyldiphospho-muramoylpentapeptide beta-N-acetylglucosaminyltransferase [Ruminococcaceae bacterium]|nr:undecaprenyldiphospho-muramoylpentapeptide beta-N-acetylglucosaminyltransferase [Oscillospiraceae bacterium]HCB65649.1 undecaprenyldiphospho-muramoylpentapeptide beta-N-acetylglucosaminyltransferase [Oscillospiraceae bacterium]
MRVLFVCGGTGGHINPALAVAGYLKKQQPNAQILFAGSPLGMEAGLVPKAGFDFAPIKVKGFQRQLSWRNLKNNMMAVVYLTTSGYRSRQILREFRPDVVMGTGGYVSGPLVRQAAKMGIPTLTHEQNAFPGVTTKLLSKYVDRVMLAVPEAKKYLNPNAHFVVTGNPVREAFFTADRNAVRKKMGLEGKICVLSFGGSLGARRVNEAMAELIAHNQNNPNIFHIHATGAYGTELFPQLLKEKGITNSKTNPNLDIREYIYDMPECFAAADLVIGRSGASTLSELEAAGKASILIPSPNVAENHQYHNAMTLVRKDAAVVIEEKDLTGKRLCDAFDRLFADPERLRRLGENAASLAINDANDRIYRQIIELASKQ